MFQASKESAFNGILINLTLTLSLIKREIRVGIVQTVPFVIRESRIILIPKLISLNNILLVCVYRKPRFSLASWEYTKMPKAVGINVLRNAVYRETIARLLEFHINRVAR